MLKRTNFLWITLWTFSPLVICAAEADAHKKNNVPSLLSLSARTIARAAHQDATFAETLETKIPDDLQPLVKKHYIDNYKNWKPWLRYLEPPFVETSPSVFFKLLSEECFVTADEKEIQVCYNDGSANRIAKTDDPITDARHYKNGSIMFIHGVDRYSVYHPERGYHIKKHSGYKLTRSVSVIPLFRYLAFYDTSASQVRWCLTGEPDLLHNELIDQTMINLVGSEIVTSYYTCLNGEFYTIIKKIDSHNIQSDYSNYCTRFLGRSILRNSLLFVVPFNGTIARIAPGKPIPSCIEPVTKMLVEQPGESFVNYVLPLTPEKVAVSYADGNIKIFDLKTDTVYAVQNSSFHVNDIDATSNFLVAASADRVRVFDFYGNDIWDFFQDNTAIKNIRACGDTLAIQFADNSASVINLKLETISWSSLCRAHALMKQGEIKNILRGRSCTLL